MSTKRLEVKGNYILLTDVITNKLEFQYPKKDTFFKHINNSIYFYTYNNTVINFLEIKLSDIYDISQYVDENNIPFISNQVLFTFLYENTGNFSGGGISPIIVNTYNDLPDASSSLNIFYYVLNSQGTKWLPGSLGGTYYSNGLYYSNGVEWNIIDIPYQATQIEANAGINNDKFITPFTLYNYFKWDTKEPFIPYGTTSQYWRGDKTWQELPISTDDDGNTIIENNLILQGGMILPEAINVELISNTNNLLISNLENGVLVRMTSTGNFSLTGIVPPDITKGGLLFIANVGNNNITLKNNDAGSIAQNRFIMGGDKTLQSGESAIFVYDTISLRYRMFSVNI